jgi:hypothetical protein
MGCSGIGPHRINIDRSAYNDIVSQSNHEQLLSNIVRIAYAEPHSYLQVTSVTASYSLSQTLSVTPSWTSAFTPGTGTTITKGFSATPGITYSDSPTISYIPLDDATFVRMMQKPIAFDDIDLLFHQGYDNIDYLGRLLFMNIGALDNASSAVNPRSISLPQYKDFYRFVDGLAEMQKNQMAILSPIIFQGQPGLNIEFIHHSSQSAAAMKLKKLLRLPDNSKNIVLLGYVAKTDSLTVNQTTQLIQSDKSALPKNLVYVKMRSLRGILSFLSHSVQIPEADQKANFSRTLMDLQGQPYDWTPLMKGLMTIYSSDTEPKEVFVKTRVNGHWFYIKKSDLDSKVTFNLIFVMMSIMNGLGAPSTAQQAPILTKAV